VRVKPKHTPPHITEQRQSAQSDASKRPRGNLFVSLADLMDEEQTEGAPSSSPVMAVPELECHGEPDPAAGELDPVVGGLPPSLPVAPPSSTLPPPPSSFLPRLALSPNSPPTTPNATSTELDPPGTDDAHCGGMSLTSSPPCSRWFRRHRRRATPSAHSARPQRPAWRRCAAPPRWRRSAST